MVVLSRSTVPQCAQCCCGRGVKLNWPLNLHAPRIQHTRAMSHHEAHANNTNTLRTLGAHLSYDTEHYSRQAELDARDKEEKETREIELQVRLVSGAQFTIDALSDDTVEAVKQKIVAHQHYTGKHLKLIHQGRVLADPLTLQQCRIVRAAVVHCAVSDSARPHAPAPDEQAPRGFDRLRGMGLSADEVAAVRAQFVQSHAASAVPRETQLQLEEQWIEHELSPEDRLVAAAHERESVQREGSYAQLFGGMCAGFVLGLVALCGLWDHALTRRAKFGLLTGLSLNICFGLIRLSSL